MRQDLSCLVNALFYKQGFLVKQSHFCIYPPFLHKPVEIICTMSKKSG